MNSLLFLDDLELQYAKGLPVPENKGASAAQENLQNQEASFYQTVQAQQQTQFQNQSQVLQQLTSAWAPIVNAGPSQQGFSPAQLSVLNSQAIEGNANSYKNAEVALNNQIAARGGGNQVIPSGADSQLRGEVASAGAQSTAGDLLRIQNANYTAGRENFLAGTSALSGVASLQNPVGYTNAATTTGNDAFNAATTVQKANAAASPWGAIGGLVGGLAGSFLGPIGSAVGSKLGGFIGGSASGSGSGSAFDPSDDGGS